MKSALTSETAIQIEKQQAKDDSKPFKRLKFADETELNARVENESDLQDSHPFFRRHGFNHIFRNFRILSHTLEICRVDRRRYHDDGNTDIGLIDKSAEIFKEHPAI
jgi:hypothetical protein